MLVNDTIKSSFNFFYIFSIPYFNSSFFLFYPLFAPHHHPREGRRRIEDVWNSFFFILLFFSFNSTLCALSITVQLLPGSHRKFLKNNFSFFSRKTKKTWQIRCCKKILVSTRSKASLHHCTVRFVLIESQRRSGSLGLFLSSDRRATLTRRRCLWELFCALPELFQKKYTSAIHGRMRGNGGGHDETRLDRHRRNYNTHTHLLLNSDLRSR